MSSVQGVTWWRSFLLGIYAFLSVLKIARNLFYCERRKPYISSEEFIPTFGIILICTIDLTEDIGQCTHIVCNTRFPQYKILFNYKISISQLQMTFLEILNQFVPICITKVSALPQTWTIWPVGDVACTLVPSGNCIVPSDVIAVKISQPLCVVKFASLRYKNIYLG